MIHRNLFTAAFGLVAIATLASTGCATYGPHLGMFAYPIPVSPFFQNQLEEQAWDRERYAKVPILDPLTPGAPAIAMDPPSDDEVMRAMEKAHMTEGGLPLLHETQRNNVRIVKEIMADSIDPPRVYPLIGPAQLHHARYKCTVYYSNVIHVGWPIPYTTKNEDAREVLYIDHDHLHRVGNVDGGMGPTPPIPGVSAGAGARPGAGA
jgi:hypothetical protein